VLGLFFNYLFALRFNHGQEKYIAKSNLILLPAWGFKKEAMF